MRATKISGAGADKSLAPIRGRQKFMVSDLPFPGGRTAYWRKYFVPPLIAWAGSQVDPFGTNNNIGSEATRLWKTVLPTIILEQRHCDILTGVVRI